MGGSIDVDINGKSVAALVSWSNEKKYFFEWKIVNIQLNKGKNNIRLTSRNGSFFAIDGIEVLPEKNFVKETASVETMLKKNVSIALDNVFVSSDIIPSSKESRIVELFYSYSPYWRLNGAKPFIADYYANGFFTDEKTSNKRFIYLPEKLYNMLYRSDLLLFSVISGGLLWIFIVRKLYKK